MDWITREYRTVRSVSGPLLFVEGVRRAAVGEPVSILLPRGETRRGLVIEISDRYAVIQVLDEMSGIGLSGTRIRFSESAVQMPLSPEILGRRFNGAGDPIDALPPPLPERWVGIAGSPINPAAREKPSDFIETGLSAIDGLNTLVRGQKLPIFSGAGLPAGPLAAQIFRQARILSDASDGSDLSDKSPDGSPEKAVFRGGGGAGFAVVFAAIGIPSREAGFFLEAFDRSGVSEQTVVYLNLADDPTIERLLTPRLALTAAEYLAFDLGRHVLVLMTDIAHYCEALREVSTAREEIPGRRSYPGYMYTDLATLFERAGRIRGRPGSVTQIPIVTMPDDDITHPIPDLTGYITEGQIVLSRELHRKGISPPIDVLPSLSRLMNLGIGEGKSRADHRGVADQLYALYADGRELRRLEAIVGEEGLTPADRRRLEFAKRFEEEFIHQGDRRRTVGETLDLGWRLLSRLPKTEMVRIRPEHLQKYYREDL